VLAVRVVDPPRWVLVRDDDRPRPGIWTGCLYGWIRRRAVVEAIQLAVMHYTVLADDQHVVVAVDGCAGDRDQQPGRLALVEERGCLARLPPTGAHARTRGSAQAGARAILPGGLAQRTERPPRR
jgi:hypothetical protein